MSQTINRIGDGQSIVDATCTFALLDIRQNKTLAVQGELEAALKPLLLPRAV
jgi:hypothetical protein